MAALAVSGESRGGPVKRRAPERCSEAYAILGWSPASDEKVWERVGWVMYTRPRWQIVEQHERGALYKASFRQYRIQGREGAAAYVAHCGFGGTCNAIADSFVRWYKRVGIPAVFCGPLPAVFHSPSVPTIPKPDLTDYYKPGVGEEPAAPENGETKAETKAE